LIEQESSQSSGRTLSTKALSLLDPAYFAKNILNYEVEPHHQRILNHITGTKKTLDLSPRGFDKSTIGDISFCLWRIAQNRNIRILIVSNTQSRQRHS